MVVWRRPSVLGLFTFLFLLPEASRGRKVQGGGGNLPSLPCSRSIFVSSVYIKGDAGRNGISGYQALAGSDIDLLIGA